LFFDGAHKSELRAATIQIMPFPMRFKIHIAFKVIREKSNAHFQRDKLARKFNTILLAYLSLGVTLVTFARVNEV
jgi:hypothetical protein